MPIRFRCPHCNQLMGIARRKAGSMVNCPTCNTPVLVPLKDEVEESPAPAAAPAPQPAPAPSPAAPAGPTPPRELFERDDFDALLGTAPSGFGEPRNNAPVHAAGREVERPQPGPAPRREPIQPAPWNVAPAPAPAPPPPVLAPEGVGGVVLSPTKATILTVVVILLLAVAFGSGLIIGRYYL